MAHSLNQSICRAAQSVNGDKALLNVTYARLSTLSLESYTDIALRYYNTAVTFDCTLSPVRKFPRYDGVWYVCRFTDLED
jgi:hypothetical protein